MKKTITESWSVSPRLDFDIIPGWQTTISGTYTEDNTNLRNTTYRGGAVTQRSSGPYNNSLKSIEVSGEGPLLTLSGHVVRLALGAGYRSNNLTASQLIRTPSTSFRVLNFSEDGQSVAFLKRVSGRTQVWIAKIDGTRSETLTSSTVDVDDFAWSADGRSIIYAAYPSLLDVRAEVDREAAQGFLYDDRFIPGKSRRPLPLQTVPKSTFALDISSRLLRNANEQELNLLTDSRTPVVPTDALEYAKSTHGNVAWTRATGPLPENEELTVALTEGSRIRCQASACGSGIKGLWWSADGQELRILRTEGWAQSQTALYRWEPSTGRIIRTFLTEDLVAGCQPLHDDLICAHETSTRPRRLAVLHANSGRLDPVFDPNPNFASLSLAVAKRLRWRNAIGFEVFGDLVLPPDHKRGDRHPVIIVQYVSRGFLRGGVGDEYPIQLFAAHGYAVLSFHRPLDFGFSIKADDIYQRIRADNADWTDRQS